MSASPRTIASAAKELREGSVTSQELIAESLQNADELDADYGLFTARYADQAREAAVRADALVASGGLIGPLHGIPIGIKDIISTIEGPTSAQSEVHDPAAVAGDAIVIRRLRDAGAIIVGKLTTMEFAIGAPDTAKPFPIPRNPWSRHHWAGGSSSGSASAVALGSALGALGTDTSGSIRLPAAFCGVTGLMPTFGRVPKSGCVPLGFTLDRIGPLARTAEDCAIIFDAIAGHDASDPMSVRLPRPTTVQALQQSLDGVRVGYNRLDHLAGNNEDPKLQEAFDEALAVLGNCGAELIPIDLPFYTELAAANLVTMLSEAFTYHRPNLAKSWDAYGAPARELLVQGALFSAADYIQAQRVRRVGQVALEGLFSRVDLVVTPTAAAEAVTLEALAQSVMSAFATAYTSYWDAAGHPAMSVPCGTGQHDLPLGLQVIGRPYDEALVLRAGNAFQRRTEWHAPCRRDPCPGRTHN